MNESRTFSSQNEDMLKELALRLVSAPGDPRTRDPQLFVGQLPQGLSLEVPIPDGSRLLGSLVRNPQVFEIILDSELEPEGVIAFYKERLGAAGWNELDWPPMAGNRGGFTPTGLFGEMGLNAQFCRGERGPSLRVNTIARKAEPTKVALHIDTGSSFSPCAQRSMIQRQMRSAMSGSGLQTFIPKLTPPDGAQQILKGANFSFVESFSSAFLDAEMDMATLSAHYATQLEKAGWTRTGEGQDGPLAWHTWTFRDEGNEPGRGLFFLLKVPGIEHQYFMYIQAKSGNAGEGAWFTPVSYG